jgi:hypothetical protein
LSPVSEYTDKQRVALGIDREQPIPALHAMYFLSNPETVRHGIQISPMSPANTCIELIERSFRLDLGNHEHSKNLMEKAAGLVKSVPAYRLSYRHDYQGNQDLLELITSHIQQ